LYAREAFLCLQHLLVELQVVLTEVLRELFEVKVGLAVVVEVIFVAVFLVYWLQRLLAGCRLRVAARARPLP
jgi:hypothetical protein